MSEKILTSFIGNGRKVVLTEEEIIFSNEDDTARTSFPRKGSGFIWAAKSNAGFIDPRGVQPIISVRFESLDNRYAEEFSGTGIEEFHHALSELAKSEWE